MKGILASLVNKLFDIMKLILCTVQLFYELSLLRHYILPIDFQLIQLSMHCTWTT